MIRVGFVVADTGKGWVGGINYIANLLHAIHALPQRRIEPVVICAPDTAPTFLAALPPVDIIRTPVVEASKLRRATRRLSERLIGRDLPMEAALRANRIDVLSHSGHLGRRAQIPTLAWFPDFQHRHLPELFEAHEIAARDKAATRFAESASRIVVSSADAQRDLAAFFPAALPKSRVLHFVSGFGGVPAAADDEALRRRHGIDGPYFHLPNQFWVHKNHAVVIDALALLKSRGRNALVVSTGHTADHRRPDHFHGLMERIKDRGLESWFRVLGLVPYEDLAGLMTNAVAVINPSRFEGWSTTVEEAKSLGKTLLLADIAVHREQAPPRGLFFDPDDSGRLADLMANTLDSYSHDEDLLARSAAAASLKERFVSFGRNYEQIVVEASR